MPRRTRTASAARRRDMTQAAMLIDERPALREEATGTGLFDLLKHTAKRTRIDDEELFIVEGDLILDEDELMIYALNQERARRERVFGIAPTGLGIGIAAISVPTESAALVGLVQGGKIVRWREGLVLTYCVLKGTFFDDASYVLVRENMKKATEDWQRICGIRFEHRLDLDTSPGVANPGAVFTVRGIDAGGQFIASAFFPNDPKSRRRVLVDPSYFSPLRFDKIGVLRHELGHVLGFRHEHIRAEAPAACPDEPLFGTTPLTVYDPRSVMHYFCGGVGTSELSMTELDRLGAQTLYGPPFDGFAFVE